MEESLEKVAPGSEPEGVKWNSDIPNNRKFVSKGIPVSAKKSHVRKGFQSNFECVSSLLASAVGLGNVWRFPYLCQMCGGMFLQNSPLGVKLWPNDLISPIGIVNNPAC